MTISNFEVKLGFVLTDADIKWKSHTSHIKRILNKTMCRKLNRNFANYCSSDKANQSSCNVGYKRSHQIYCQKLKQNLQCLFTL